ncbi:histone deacetylase [Thiosulfatimonas sediminis]|uniref:Histone deacetylase n=1 Tax=Thiosulfatimonas sediminis TaxID=2675054 RepID=A0A6F8PYA4_9GAMM|nr:histone deacetylase [Thiosulfatimonas sediminis]BBP47115.1 histone deacetylase [Thiosulfatimonas sediminis]
MKPHLNRRQFITFSLAASFGLLPVSKLQAALSSKHKVGTVLDPLFFKHTREGHAESAERLIAIDKELTRRDYWSYLTPVKTRMASKEELLSTHQSGYVFEIETLAEEGNEIFYSAYSNDTYINKHTYDAARMAAGSNIELNLAVYDRQIDRGFALLRPPGHHARADQAMGFCIFNSDVIAAKALQKYRGVERIAIIDFDVHHGNGTQDLTIKDPSILAISIHQHPFWPMTGFSSFTGIGAGEGKNLNCPFHKGAGNRTYLEVYDKVIQPKLEAFKPEHIIVFAGYDGHWQDPLAGHQLSVAGYNKLVQKCINSAEQLCGGRISFSLGGGYNLEPLAQSVAGTMHTLLGLEEPFIDQVGESEDFEQDYSEEITKLQQLHFGKA